MILTDREIQIALINHQIRIEPEPDVGAYSSTSVDLKLDPHLSEFREDLADDPLESVIDPAHKNFVVEKTLLKLTRQIEISDEGYLLRPRKLVLGWTREKIDLPIRSRLAARVEGKSSLARLGVGIHVTAPTIHSGFANKIRLEIVNHGAIPIRLRADMKICQLIFESTLGTPQKGFEPSKTALPPILS